MVLVDSKTDGFQDEISPDIKKWVKTKSLIYVYPFSIPGKFHPGTRQFFCQQVLSLCSIETPLDRYLPQKEHGTRDRDLLEGTWEQDRDSLQKEHGTRQPDRK